ncbi:hypothetical protein K525DRAFT_232303 [Schizophyllum commune Loenen D]|nr:hypothetical protein K525DRAFT_232303 [Schizophyllum commune Loenen D]
MASTVQFPSPQSQPLSPISQNTSASPSMPGGLPASKASTHPPPVTKQGAPQSISTKQGASAKQAPPPATRQGPPPAPKPAAQNGKSATLPPSKAPQGVPAQPKRQATAPPPKQTPTAGKSAPASAGKQGGAQAMCSYCHQKPCYNGFPHCSKTCAKQAASLCDFCRKKDKYPGFDFCGKRCANQAAKTGQAVKRSTGGKGPLSGPLGNIINILSSNVGNLGSVMNSNGLDPLQVAKLVIQQLPPAQQAPLMLALTAATALAKGASAAFNGGNGSSAATSQNAQTHGSIATATFPAECALAGCNQPVFVDSNGDTGEYCSARHREEAVQTGQATACIMCRKYPQHGNDDFCGRACRDDAAQKGLPP